MENFELINPAMNHIASDKIQRFYGHLNGSMNLSTLFRDIPSVFLELIVKSYPICVHIGR